MRRMAYLRKVVPCVLAVKKRAGGIATVFHFTVSPTSRPVEDVIRSDVRMLLLGIGEGRM